MNQFIHLISGIFLLFLASDCLSAELLREQMQSGNLRREYYVHVPTTYQKDRVAPLVFVFHGGDGNAPQIANFSGFNSLSDKHGFIAVYPQAIDKHWNDGRNGEKFRDHDARINDVAWIAELITRLAQKYSIDPGRVYAIGISNGGIFSQRLAIELSPHFSAVASLAAQIAEPLAKAIPKDKVSVLIMNGTKDPFVPYEGGEVTPHLFPRLAKRTNQASRGKVISTDDTIKFWLSHNGINVNGRLSRLPDLDKGDGSTVERSEWTSKLTGASVVLYKVIGGGHTWPGAKQYLPVRTIGNTCRDFDASEAIWSFFSKHRKRQK